MLLPLQHVLAASSFLAYTCLRVTPSAITMQLSRLLGLELAGVATTQALAAAMACNGHEQLCGRRYSDVTLIGSHNSAFVGDSPAHNQYVSVTRQLDLGVRFLQAQTQDKGGVIELCHTYCWELDAGPLTTYLREIADWLAAHPDEVLTLLLTNIDAIAVDKFDAAFDSTGLKKYVFRPPATATTPLARDQWPTLQELIGAGTRLIVFMDYHADRSKADYILSEFDYFWETPYGVTDKAFPTCAVDRPSGGDAQKLMGLMNHMLNFKIGDIVFPDQLDAPRTNSLASIQKQVDLCKSQGKPQPNVILVSFDQCRFLWWCRWSVTERS
ncbi:PLC-like phosphodiesterase, TIM beta/alpha-barrel domain protein [Purpureocillium lavendulum]|uniref:PLC-like phosphodiesterase, TIM beta/alpha-barrel domain protein n=1 Tax=Purpureocillium lavendulum TaxID=1247861 RepID=A0AB34FWD5_9HYPO|nr:PLC-like phosphodiesterase, TIM beta/alpha-barrel domain protein [Purpureocillium lavendulum]